MAYLAYHLHIIRHTLTQTLCLKQLVAIPEIGLSLIQINGDLAQCGSLTGRRSDKQGGRIDAKHIVLAKAHTINRVHGRDGFDLIVPEHYP